MENINNDVNEPFRAGLASNALPKAESNLKADSSQTGVSSRSVPPPSVFQRQQKLKWFVIRATYGQENKGIKHLKDEGVRVFIPTITKLKVIDGVRKPVAKSCLPNMLFALSTEKRLQELVERNSKAPYLRFYCRYYLDAGVRRRQIITVPDVQMDSFMKICETRNSDIRICNEVIHKFAKGEYVRVIAGPFEGVQGRVVSIYGKKRVGIVIDNLVTVMTSYVPDAYLEKIEDE